jgi:hypothetical protein
MSRCQCERKTNDHPVLTLLFVGVFVLGVASQASGAEGLPTPKLPKAPKLPRQGAAPVIPQAGAAPSAFARRDIPPRFLSIYRAKSTQRQCPRLSWTVLAGIGKVESDHGRSSAPGVRSGVNRFGCCAGPMQFNLRNGPPSTWRRYGRGSVYRPEDAIPSAAHYLCEMGAQRNLRRALLRYNASGPYVNGVLALADRYGGR